MNTRFDTKSAAPQAVWDALEEKGVARFPFPPHGRIPNFDGAPAAAERLFEQEPFRSAQRLKVNPDAPQRHVRIEALRRGCEVLVPTPRLRGGFKRLDPATIPDDDLKSAASLSNMDQWAEPVALDDLPLSWIVTPDETIEVDDPPAPPTGIDWAALSEADLEEMPVLREFRG